MKTNSEKQIIPIQSARRRGPRVLVVDDDASMRDLLALHLNNAGYVVTLAEDAVVAGRLLLSGAPDLLIVDVQMPYWGGLDFVATLIADATVPCVPTIVISAEGSFADAAGRLGVAFLHKPFFKHDLLEAVEKALSVKQVEAVLRPNNTVRREKHGLA